MLEVGTQSFVAIISTSAAVIGDWMLRVVALKFCASGAYVPWHLGTRCRMVDVVIVERCFVLLPLASAGNHELVALHSSFSDLLCHAADAGRSVFTGAVDRLPIAMVIDPRGLLRQCSELVAWIAAMGDELRMSLLPDCVLYTSSRLHLSSSLDRSEHESGSRTID